MNLYAFFASFVMIKTYLQNPSLGYTWKCFKISLKNNKTSSLSIQHFNLKWNICIKNNLNLFITVTQVFFKFTPSIVSDKKKKHQNVIAGPYRIGSGQHKFLQTVFTYSKINSFSAIPCTTAICFLVSMFPCLLYYALRWSQLQKYVR